MTKHYNIKPLLYRRRELRSNMTTAEKLLWVRIRRRQLGIRFLRQYSVDGYVLDFYSPEIKLAIELDGAIHSGFEQRDYDKQRQDFLEEFGSTFLRFTNSSVIDSMEFVIQKLIRKIDELIVEK